MIVWKTKETDCVRIEAQHGWLK